MRVILQVIAGPAQGRQIPLQSGERARFGRSEIADVCFPDDTEMSDVHFELECQADQCLVRDVTGSGGTFLNDEKVAEAPICDGDQILAGRTQLRTVVNGQGGDDVEAADEVESKPEAPKLTAIELCQMTDLEEESLQLFRPKHSPEEFIRVLTENKQFADAIRVLTLYLPKRQTVFWAHRSVEEVSPRELINDERAALQATRAWLEDPTEENRRAAMQIAETSELQHAAGCVAAAASWSEGSMAPAEFDEVLPDPKLTAQVAAAALIMIATDGETSSIEDRYQKILQIGQQLLSGELEISF